MKKNSILKAGVFVLALATFGGCAKNQEVEPTITNIAVTNPDFQTLEDAAIRGDVAILLGNPNKDPQSGGNFTVFAPTNAAFARLGLNTAQDLTTLQQPFLQTTLYYHVFSGSLPGSSLTPGATSPSAQGFTRRIIRRADNSLYVNGSKILGTDVKASNGLVHPIDKVLLVTGRNVVESAQALQTMQVFVKPELTFLVEAVLYADLATTLSSAGPFTVFAPTDQAFKDLGAILGVPLNVPADIRQLPKTTVQAVLLNHAIGGAQGGRFTSELPEGTTISSAGGAPVQVGAFANGVMTVKGASNTVPANMVIPDVQCTNGVVHVIDRVLLP
jgi:uncharacterized surface protein with fasciclin (FAS1) repeats